MHRKKIRLLGSEEWLDYPTRSADALFQLGLAEFPQAPAKVYKQSPVLLRTAKKTTKSFPVPLRAIQKTASFPRSLRTANEDHKPSVPLRPPKTTRKLPPCRCALQRRLKLPVPLRNQRRLQSFPFRCALPTATTSFPRAAAHCQRRLQSFPRSLALPEDANFPCRCAAKRPLQVKGAG